MSSKGSRTSKSPVKYGKSKRTRRTRRTRASPQQRLLTIRQQVARETRRAERQAQQTMLGSDFLSWPLFNDEYQQYVGKHVKRMTDADGRARIKEDLDNVMFDIQEIPVPPALYGRMKSDYLITDAADIDFDWIAKQYDYVASLSIKDAYILRSYTWVADRLINNSLRGSLQRKLFFDSMELPTYDIFHNPFLFYYMYDNRIVYEPTRRKDREMTFNKDHLMEYLRTNFDRCMVLFKADLTRIINAAPRPTRPMVVYRGVSTIDYLQEIVRKGTAPFKPVDFQSTSFKVQSANRFADPREGAMIRLRILPGTPCVYIAPVSHFSFFKEQEVLLPPNIAMAYTPPSNPKERFRRFLNVQDKKRDYAEIFNNYEHNLKQHNDGYSVNPKVTFFYTYDFEVAPEVAGVTRTMELGFRKDVDEVVDDAADAAE